MSSQALFLGSIAAYAGLPLIFALRRTPFQFLLLYTHIASVLTLGGILGAVYVLPVLGDISLLAGQVAYGGFMFSTLLTVIIGRDLQVVRNIIVLVVGVNAMVYLVFWLSHHALSNAEVPNPFDTSPLLFDHSLGVVLVGGTLIISELLALIAVLELAKERLGRWPMSVVYVLTFVGILTLDGVLFPTLVLRPSTGLGDFIVAGVQAKLVLAAMFAVPLLAFVTLYRPLLRRYEATPLRLGQLLSLSRDVLLDRLDEQESRLLQTTEQAGLATATVSRILDAASTTIIIATDPDLRITHFNHGAEELLGYSADEVIGRSPAILHTEEELARQAALFDTSPDLASLVAAQVATGEHRDWAYRTRDGRTVMVSLSITEIRVDELLVGYLGAGEDVTSRLQAERAVAGALELEQSSVARLEEASRVKDELVSTISHELRTPITSIQGYTELLSDGSLGELSPEQGGALDRVLRNTSRLQVLVDDLLFVAEADSGELTLGLAPLDLRQVVESARDSVAVLARQREDLQVRYDLPEEPVMVRGDAPSLERVVLNLCGNAVKFTPEAGSVTVRVEEAGAGAALVVADTGIGIAEEDHGQLFRRFFRAPEANRRAIPGSGLGLSVVHEIVTRQGGTIEVLSAPGEGTTVTVWLPRTGAPAQP
jgi:PAS domain S-box-containing protein